MNEQLLTTLHCKKKVIIKTRTLIKQAEHTDSFLMAGSPFTAGNAITKEDYKLFQYIILQYWLSVMFHTVIRFQKSHFSQTKESQIKMSDVEVPSTNSHTFHPFTTDTFSTNLPSI